MRAANDVSREQATASGTTHLFQSEPHRHTMSDPADPWPGGGQATDVDDGPDLEVLPDGGDGGTDLRINGAEIQVKTVSPRYAEQPELWVNAYQPCSADYYVLVSRLGPSTFRLVGYAPRSFVWNAPKPRHNGDPFRVVDREYLFPIPQIRPVNL
jgi:hypothetical protein